MNRGIGLSFKFGKRHTLLKASAICVSVGTVVGLLPVVIGCSGKPATVPVSGRVTLDGKPEAGIVVTFTPKGGGIAASGITDQEGRYQLQTVEQPRRVGAVPGMYSVTFALPDAASETDEVVPVSGRTLAERFTDGSITFEVGPKGTNEANFELRSK